MTHDDLTRAAEAAVNDLGEILWNAQASSIAESEARLEGYAHQTYPHLRPAVTRVAMREALRQEALPSGWKLGGSPQQSGQLLIVRDSIELRFLKERSLTYPGGVPAAGCNNARQAWWRQPQLPLPELERHTTTLSGIEPARFLLLWDYLSPDRREEGFTLRIVHTIGAGKYGLLLT